MNAAKSAKQPGEGHWPSTAAQTDLSGFHFYRSPFADWQEPRGFSTANIMTRSFMVDSDPHGAWSKNVELFTATGDYAALEMALKRVTSNNPPLDHDIWMETEPTGLRVWEPGDIGFVIIAATSAIVTAGIFGGFKAMAATFVVLFIIYAVAWFGSDD